MTEKISIVIPAFNQLAYCRECIDSIRAATPPDLYNLVLVDNGSTDGVSEYFDSVPDARVIHAPENLGFAGGVNLGLECVKGHALILNSDTVTPRGWLERLHLALKQAPDIGIVGPCSNNVSGNQLIPNLEIADYECLNTFAEQLARDKAGKLRYVARLVGFCMLIRDETLRTVGYFDTAYGIGNFEDDDYCVRALRAGFKLAIADDAFVFHYGGRTFSAMGITDDRYNALIEENEALFLRKLNPCAEERIDNAQHAMAACRAGKEALERGAMKEAVAALVDGVKAWSGYAPLHVALADALETLGQPEKAYERLAFAFQLAPEDEAIRRAFLDTAKRIGRETQAQRLIDCDASGNQTRDQGA